MYETQQECESNERNQPSIYLGSFVEFLAYYIDKTNSANKRSINI